MADSGLKVKIIEMNYPMDSKAYKENDMEKSRSQKTPKKGMPLCYNGSREWKGEKSLLVE